VGAETRIDTINIPAAAAGLSWSDHGDLASGGRPQQVPDGAFLGRNLVRLP
jgi:hypothetical protein